MVRVGVGNSAGVAFVRLGEFAGYLHTTTFRRDFSLASTHASISAATHRGELRIYTGRGASPVATHRCHVRSVTLHRAAQSLPFRRRVIGRPSSLIMCSLICMSLIFFILPCKISRNNLQIIFRAGVSLTGKVPGQFDPI